MLFEALRQTTEYKRLLAAIDGKNAVAALFGLPSVARAHLLAALCADTGRPALVVCAGDVKIGSLKHLPPTLLAQYHFTNFGAFKPYVGAGINYTRFSSVKFDPAVEAALDPSIKKNSWGGALQVGFDYALDKNWSINFDVKKVYIATDVYSFGTKVGKFKVDPLLVGVGVGYRF